MQEEDKFSNICCILMAAYLHTHNTVLWKQNRKELFQMWLRRISLGGIEGGCQLK